MLLDGDMIQSLEERFGMVYTSGSDETITLCPYCHHRNHSPDRSGHLAINFKKNVAHCVRCDWGCKDVFSWMKKRGMDLGGYGMKAVSNIRRALGDIKNQLDGEKKAIPYQPQSLEYPEGYERFELDDDELPFLRRYIKSMSDKKIGLKQLRARRVGYCDEGRYKGYVIFPFYEDGKLVYWQGRGGTPKLLADKKRRKVNPSKVEAPLGKAYWFYGMHRATVGGFAVLCEGPLDQLTLDKFVKAEYGEHAYALSVQGHTVSFPSEDKHPLNSQIGKLLALRPEKICVLFDADVREVSTALVELLCNAGFNAYAGYLPANKDPNDLHDKSDGLKAATSKLSWADEIRLKLA